MIATLIASFLAYWFESPKTAPDAIDFPSEDEMTFEESMRVW